MASYYCITVVLLILSLNCHAENATNLFDIRNECNTVEKYVAVILFSLLLLYGIASNVLLMVVYCIHNNIYSRTFIHITYQIIVCSFLNFIPQMIVVLGGILWNKNFDTDMSIRIHRIFAAMDTFTFFATLHFTFLLAINRLVVICFPKFNAFFESIKFYFLISFLWLLSFDNILAISLTEFHCCIKTFHVSNLHWSINCTKRMSEIGVVFLNVRRLLKSALKLNKTYGCKAKSAIRNDKYERSMLIQAATVCGVMEIEIICFYFLLKFAVNLIGKKAEIPVNIFINCYVIFNNAVLPTVNLIFVKRFRSIIRYIIRKLSFKKIKIKRIKTFHFLQINKISLKYQLKMLEKVQRYHFLLAIKRRHTNIGTNRCTYYAKKMIKQQKHNKDII
ncbi:unnamed protein product [Brugia pahangi]|uniref:G_PROTEIN_RECEP_F1_2 domain-containing protein n=1 Tax=Brugia pahangi TaxID=6280 RepID=A0A0N4TSM4_BRUPA|nr:unnamed protein product [Brugia pahangi]